MEGFLVFHTLSVKLISPSVVSIKAGRLLLVEIDNFISHKMDFSFETTLAGKTYVNLIKKEKSK